MVPSSIILRRCLLRQLQTTLVTRRALASVSSVQGGTGNYTKLDVWNLLNQKQDERNDMAYSMAFGDDNQKLSMPSSMVEPSALMREQLRISHNQLRRPMSSSSSTTSSSSHHLDTMELPKTLADVVRQKSRAIVVTETSKPFRVVDVNQCWEGLCGYSFTEARGKTLGSLLKGPETDAVAATGLIAHLLNGEKQAGAVLTNYTKDGRPFKNRIRVGPIVDATGAVTHFVGVLEELYDSNLANMTMPPTRRKINSNMSF